MHCVEAPWQTIFILGTAQTCSFGTTLCIHLVPQLCTEPRPYTDLGSNSEADRRHGIAWSLTTIKYNLATQTIIRIFSVEGNEITIYFNPFASFGNAEIFQQIHYFQESRTILTTPLIRVLQKCLILSLSPVLILWIKLLTWSVETCGDLSSWIHGTTVAVNSQHADFYNWNLVECYMYLIWQTCYNVNLAFNRIKERGVDHYRVCSEMNYSYWW